ncbi:MAG: hypothetical protein LBG61_02150 [Burkholderiales bacterium]|nr:hypothetical protein [Burkholderiales bacterium]
MMKFRIFFISVVLLTSMSCAALTPMTVLPVQWFDTIAHETKFKGRAGLVNESFDYQFSPAPNKAVPANTPEDFAKMLDQKFSRATLYGLDVDKERFFDGKLPKIETCRDLFKLGEELKDTSFLKKGIEQRSHLRNCIVFKAISEMKPSKVSFLPAFPLDEATVKTLPSELVPDNPHNKLSFKDIETYEVIDHTKKYTYPEGNILDVAVFLKGAAPGYGVNLTPLARGDFDGDGVEDVILNVDSTYGYGSKQAITIYNVFVLTKKSPDGKIEVIRKLLQEK